MGSTKLDIVVRVLLIGVLTMLSMSSRCVLVGGYALHRRPSALLLDLATPSRMLTSSSCPRRSSMSLSLTPVCHSCIGTRANALAGLECFRPSKHSYISSRYLARSRSPKQRKNFIELDILETSRSSCAKSDTFPPEAAAATAVSAAPRVSTTSSDGGGSGGAATAALEMDDAFWAAAFKCNAGPSTGEFAPRFNILSYPNDKLRLPNVPVTRFDSNLADFARRMFNTMYHADGIGLAAPQVGVNVRLLVFNELGDPSRRSYETVMINPEIVWMSPERDVMDEGCLSFPGTALSRGLATVLEQQQQQRQGSSGGSNPSSEAPLRDNDDEDGASTDDSTDSLEEGPVLRSLSVEVRYQDLSGRSRQVRLEGFTARLFQHEFDHLKGVLLVDKVEEQLRAMGHTP